MSRFSTRFLLAVLVGGAAIISAIVLLSRFEPVAPQKLPQEPVVNTTTPALDYAETLTCSRGLRRVQIVRGQEDSFSRGGDEPARVDPSMLRFGLFEDIAQNRVRTFGRRDYDDNGSDKALVDYFDIPKGLVSGHLVLRLRDGANGIANDSIQLIPAATYRGTSGAERLAQFAIGIVDPSVKPIGTPQDGVVSIALSALQPQILDPKGTIITYLRKAQDETGKDSASVSLLIWDDTNVDVAALVLCLEPDAIEGVTLSEHSDKPLGDDYSILQCSSDFTQSGCGPFGGDTACTKALPIACYKDGGAQMPTNLTSIGLPEGSFVGGQVRLTRAVAAASFAKRDQVNAFCVAQFGAGWRVLKYGEGSGIMVISRSNIPSKTKVWIDIADQPLGRCWDRANPVDLPQ